MSERKFPVMKRSIKRTRVVPPAGETYSVRVANMLVGSLRNGVDRDRSASPPGPRSVIPGDRKGVIPSGRFLTAAGCASSASEPPAGGFVVC
jgi:hypothetical protein